MYILLFLSNVVITDIFIFRTWCMKKSRKTYGVINRAILANSLTLSQKIHLLTRKHYFAWSGNQQKALYFWLLYFDIPA